MGEQALSLQPRFLGEQGARFFTTQFSGEAPAKAHIVFVPPFVEEMNRCRALVAQQARIFADHGYVCTLVDFYGTGDSEGELVDASMSIWHENLARTVEQIMSEQELPLILWGLRMGGLIALDFAAKSPVPVADILLWQPVTSGKLYLNQILRQRVASLMVRELPAETTKEIRQRLAQGEQVEVAGYTLGGDIIDDIEALDPAATANLCSGAIHWLEHVTQEGKDIGIPSQKVVEKLQQSHAVQVQTFLGPPIWMIHERDEAPQLLAATARALS